MGPEPKRVLTIRDPESGLLAVLAIDSTALGPAAGGVRTWPYPSIREAREDAVRLARTMTIKCALAGLDAGGGKCAVLDHPGLDRPAAFRVLGERVQELGGAFRTAGDLGTTSEDLAQMARACAYVHTGEGELARAVARGVLRCAEACVELSGERGGLRGLEGIDVAVQGCGTIGAAVARALSAAGAALLLADLDRERAEALASELGGRAIDADSILEAEVFLLVPCASGGAVTEEVARKARARSVCGPANHVLASPEAGQVLLRRGVLQVPDVIASAGAVIEGIGRTVMGLSDRSELIDALKETASEVLAESRATSRLPDEVAAQRAFARIQST